MPASALRNCLTSLGGTGTQEILWIITDGGHWSQPRDGNDHYLDSVCNAIKPGYSYDKQRTERPPYLCLKYGGLPLTPDDHFTRFQAIATAYAYPGYGCNQGWLGRDCKLSCGVHDWNDGWLGFYCKAGWAGPVQGGQGGQGGK